MLPVAVLLITFAFGIEPDAVDVSSTATSEARLETMRGVVADFEVIRIKGTEHRPVHLVKTPLLRFNDGERSHIDGSLWVWGRGRPQVFSEVYLKHRDGDILIYHSLASASTDRVVAESPIGVNWRPEGPGIRLAELPAEVSPANDPTVRLRQMKSLVRRFRAWSVDDDGRRTELRMLSRPVHRYADSDAGLTDGAAFAFASGTNPEVIVLIEAMRSDSDVRSWQFGAIRRGNSAQYVSLDGTVVWERPEWTEGSPSQPWLYYYYSPTDRSDSGQPQLRGGAVLDGTTNELRLSEFGTEPSSR